MTADGDRLFSAFAVPHPVDAHAGIAQRLNQTFADHQIVFYQQHPHTERPSDVHFANSCLDAVLRLRGGKRLSLRVIAVT
ncbi:hypothetical protein [Rhizobium indicum]|uniref:hypothetical protein n=1 Tax=Rhizobium indicum TaxID=2583231 RepID=UPI001FEFD22D|nr:hypothetical protein [Rhizobium indicum]